MLADVFCAREYFDRSVIVEDVVACVRDNREDLELNLLELLRVLRACFHDRNPLPIQILALDFDCLLRFPNRIDLYD
jgi:hypothetical protein